MPISSRQVWATQRKPVKQPPSSAMTAQTKAIGWPVVDSALTTTTMDHSSSGTVASVIRAT